RIARGARPLHEIAPVHPIGGVLVVGAAKQPEPAGIVEMRSRKAVQMIEFDPAFLLAPGATLGPIANSSQDGPHCVKLNGARTSTGQGPTVLEKQRRHAAETRSASSDEFALGRRQASARWSTNRARIRARGLVRSPSIARQRWHEADHLRRRGPERI